MARKKDEIPLNSFMTATDIKLIGVWIETEVGTYIGEDAIGQKYTGKFPGRARYLATFALPNREPFMVEVDERTWKKLDALLVRKPNP